MHINDFNIGDLIIHNIGIGYIIKKHYNKFDKNVNNTITIKWIQKDKTTTSKFYYIDDVYYKHIPIKK